MKNVADIYPLTPTQAGILYHGLRSNDPELYFEQVRFTVTGPLDVDTLRQAIAHVVDRHPILRTRFLWDGVPEPVQVVRETVDVPFTVHDWRHRDHDTGDLDALSAELRRNGMDFDSAPLLRVVLVLRSDTDAHLIWNSHHLVLDGWSSAQVFNELSAVYAACSDGTPPMLPAAPPFKNYVAWRQQQDAERTRRFWTDFLAGFRTPTPVPRTGTGTGTGTGGSSTRGHGELVLEAGTAEALRTIAKRNRVTLNAVLLAAWGIVLGAYHDTDDVVAGVTLSGRPDDLAAVESIVGMFVTTLPMRLRPRADARLFEWIRQVNDDQSRVREFQHVSPAEVVACSALPAGEPMFNSTFVFENYPIAEDDESAVAFDVTGTFDQSHYDLDVLVLPSTTIRFAASYDTGVLSPERVARTLRHFEHVLEQIASTDADHAATLVVGDLAVRDASETEVVAQWTRAGRLDPEVDALIERAATPGAVIPDNVLAKPARLVRYLAKHRPATVVLSGARLRATLEQFGDLAIRVPHTATWVITDETPGDELIRRFTQVLPQAEMVMPYVLDTGTVLGWHHHHAGEQPTTVSLVPCARAAVELRTDRGPVPVNGIGDIYCVGRRTHLRARWRGDGRLQLESGLDQPAEASRPATLGGTVDDRDAAVTKVAEDVLDDWRQALGRADIDIDDDFFSLGGQSIVAVGLFAKLQQRYDAHLPLSALFDAATPRELARLIVHGSTPSEVASAPTTAAATYASRPWLHLVEINAGKPTEQPFVCVHGAGGNVLTYQSLAEQLGKHRPFYGLQAAGIDGIQPPHETVDEMVTAYLTELRAAFPTGPYVLGGYSGGGVIAFEMAARLLADGEDVANVIFFDTFHPEIGAQSLGITEHLRRTLDQGVAYPLSKWRARTGRADRGQTTAQAVERHEAQHEIIPFAYRNTQLSSALFALLRPYEPAVYPGRVTMLKAAEGKDGWRLVPPHRGWNELIPNLEIVETPGDHDTMILPENAVALGERVRQLLDS